MMGVTALAIDVGSGGHGWCLGELVDGGLPKILAAGWATHEAVSGRLLEVAVNPSAHWAEGRRPQRFVLEEFSHLGKPIFKDGALALRNSGYLAGILWATNGFEALTVGFPDIARWLYLGGASEPAVQRVVIESYPATGGGSTPQIGTQKQPGPLYPLRLAGKTYPEEMKTRNHHKAALAALAYGSAVWAGEVKERA